MKRIILLSVCIILTLSAFSQNQHMKFMGIPLTGSINSFQEKLKAKGINYDKASSLTIPSGVRCFSGRFSGEKATIYVYYNEKTKTVYRAKAVIKYTNKDIAEREFEKFSSMLKEKYTRGRSIEGEQNGYSAMTRFVYDEDYNDIGTVALYMTDLKNIGYSFLDDVNLHIDYEDNINTLFDREKNMDDL